MIQKFILVEGCHEDFCPFFKRHKRYDYNDLVTCAHPKHPDSQWGQPVTLRESDKYEYDRDPVSGGEIITTIPANCGEKGLFPEECPLLEVKL